MYIENSSNFALKFNFSHIIYYLSLSILIICAACEKGEGNILESSRHDKQPPSIPQFLEANSVTDSSILISWEPSIDNSKIDHYTVYQDEVQVSHDTTTSFRAANLLPETEYSFAVRATDVYGNFSALTSELKTTTSKKILSDTIITHNSNILLFTKTEGFRHTSIEKGIATLSQMTETNDFEIEVTETAADFNTVNLAKFQLVIFLNTTGDVLDSEQQSDFEQYIKSGGSFMGVHSATDTEHNWPWYGQLVGAYFDGHPNIQEATLQVVENNHDSSKHLSSEWRRNDEWYNFKNINSNINIILNLDEASYQGGTNGSNHPIAWFHEFDGGRSFYTGGGHTEAAYDDEDFRLHLLGGILYCLNK